MKNKVMVGLFYAGVSEIVHGAYNGLFYRELSRLFFQNPAFYPAPIGVNALYLFLLLFIGGINAVKSFSFLVEIIYNEKLFKNNVQKIVCKMLVRPSLDTEFLFSRA